jgi:hypothetical protein
MRDSWLRNESCRLVVLLAAALPVITVPRSATGPPGQTRGNVSAREILTMSIFWRSPSEFNLAVWSNHDYFDNRGVVRYTTASLLATLESQGESFLRGC